MKPRLFTLALCMLLIGSCMMAQAQKIYVVTDNKVQEVTITGSGCTTVAPVASCIATAFSIALKQDTLYYNWSDKIYRAILFNNTFTGCTEIGTAPTQFNSLTVDEKGVLFFVDDYTLFSMDPRTGQTVTLGNLPYAAAGDMMFYKGELYVASTDGILKVNRTTPAASNLVIHSPGSNMFGLATTPANCIANKVYGVEIGPGGTTDIVLLDLENGSVSTITCNLPYEVLDAASTAESGLSDAIDITAILTSRGCNNGGSANVRINYRGGGSYTFQLDNGPIKTTNEFSNVAPGPHTLHIRTASGCNKDTAFTVPAFSPAPALQYVTRQNTCIQAGEVAFNITSTPGYFIEYRQVQYSLTHVFTNLLPGEYNFVLTDQSGCRYDSAKIIMNPTGECDDLLFPNAFTPNNDGLNETFRPGYKLVQDYKLSVYNRWGEVVFTTNDIAHGWNGTHKGLRQPHGVYAWIATYHTTRNEKKIMKGTVMLFR